MLSKQTSVLVVDDDVRILRLIQHILEPKGYRVLLANRGESALNMISEEMPDLILLDIIMPGIDGYQVCRRIREFSQVPIIMVTVKDSELEKVAGLDAGADDYVTKPFYPNELTARVKAVLRRSKSWNERYEPAVRCEDLTIDFSYHRVTLDNQEVKLTATEFRLLSYLIRHAGRVLTPDQILSSVWGEEYASETHILQVNIARLRQRLGDDAKNPKYILTQPGIGYMAVKKP